MFTNLIISLCLSFCTFLGLNFAFLLLSMGGHNFFGKYDFDIISIFSLIMFGVYYYFLSKQEREQDSFINNENLNSNEQVIQKSNAPFAKKSFLVGMVAFVCALAPGLFIYFLSTESFSSSPWKGLGEMFLLVFLWIPGSVLFGVIAGLIYYSILKRNNK